MKNKYLNKHLSEFLHLVLARKLWGFFCVIEPPCTHTRSSPLLIRPRYFGVDYLQVCVNNLINIIANCILSQFSTDCTETWLTSISNADISDLHFVLLVSPSVRLAWVRFPVSSSEMELDNQVAQVGFLWVL